MRIVVTGRSGQLVQSLTERGTIAGHEIVALGRPALDLGSQDKGAILAALQAAKPAVIVNAAAHTAVDQAESEADLVFAINARGAGAVAQAAQQLDVPLIQISTDYVFSGDKPAPYLEDDRTGPTGVYGASKLAGEQAVLASGADATILRTAWVYSPFGSNFVKTMLRLAGERTELAVVGDQRGNPTSAMDLADAVLRVASNLVASSAPELRGIFHAAGDGDTSWADFAEAVFAASTSLGGPTARVRPVPTSDYPTLAHRPANSRLDGGKLERLHGVRLPHWRASTAAIVARLTALSQAKAGIQ